MTSAALIHRSGSPFVNGAFRAASALTRDRRLRKLSFTGIWIKSLQVIFPNGFKASGIGRELGPWGLSAFLGVRHLKRGATS